MGKSRKSFLRAERKKSDTQFIPTHAKKQFCRRELYLEYELLITDEEGIQTGAHPYKVKRMSRVSSGQNG